jgi:hypothetical protein
MQTIDVTAEIDERNEIRIKMPAGYAHRWARIHITIPDQDAADAGQTPVSTQTSESIPQAPVTLGLFRGRIHMADDFNDPLPDSFWLGGNP